MAERTLSLDELIAAQGIQPARDLDEIAALMPEGFDCDAFADLRRGYKGGGVMSTKKRLVRVSLRITDEEYHDLKRIAERYGRGVGGYLIDLHRATKGLTPMGWDKVFHAGFDHRAKEMAPQEEKVKA